MSVKTFTTETLTSADTNTYLANSGLVYITQATMTGATVSIQGCFSATYDSYLLQFTNTRCVGASVCGWRLLNGATPIQTATYNSQRASLQAGAWNTSNQPAQTYGNVMTIDNLINQGGTFTIYNPFLATTTVACGNSMYGGNANACNIELLPTTQTGTTSCDGIQIIGAGTTFTTGKVIVYGFRQS